ncbi:MAG: hypothetical protein KAG06_08850 [Methylococcales bacterium]|nr:hypothetical protein [Methylococcales bacterium]
MNNIYKKSLDLMDEYFDSISDQEFLEDYLAIEEHQGPLAKDFLIEHSIKENLLPNNYTIIGQELMLEFSDIEKDSSSPIIHTKEVKSAIYDSSYAANDESCFYDLSLAA